MARGVKPSILLTYHKRARWQGENTFPAMQNISFQDAKARVCIPDLWRHFKLPGEPWTTCNSPFRMDAKPSFSVSADGMLFNDFATGDAGDAVDFFQLASGLPRREACLKFLQLAGGQYAPVPPTARPHHTKNHETKHKLKFSDSRLGTTEDFKQLASLRNISPEALTLASQRGLLLFATIKDSPSWIVTDSVRLNAQARRMDGGPWTFLPDNPKAYTLPGASALWPIGIREAQDFPNVALVEGGPDLLAAFHFMLCESKESNCAPVAMLGAKLRIHADALPLFTGKRVRIFGHDDEAGRAAVECWAAQLKPIGADVDAFTFAGLRQVNESAVKDLNDCTSIHPDDFETERNLWNLIP